MAVLQSYKDLIVWQKSIKLVKEIYRITQKFPREEQYGLVSQLRRSAISVPSNIAEGSGRKSRKDYAHFYAMAYGSGLELETQLIVAFELNFISNKEYTLVMDLLIEVLRMLNSISRKLM